MLGDQGKDEMKGDKGQGNNTKSDKSMVPGHEDKVQGAKDQVQNNTTNGNDTSYWSWQVG